MENKNNINGFEEDGFEEEYFINSDLNKESKNESLYKYGEAIQKPSLYEVVLINDDFTPIEFVVTAVKEIFHKDDSEAMRITLDTHNSGEGHCGIFTREVAETKMISIIDLARESDYPLKCVMYKKSK